MREIEFRGKYHLIETDETIWIYGCNDWGEIVDENDDNWRVDESTIGQYSGLKDKNGVKIYEGDVLYDGKSDGVVIYRADFARYVVASRLLTKCLATYMTRVAEVIGNIFDDPELKERFWKVWKETNTNQ